MGQYRSVKPKQQSQLELEEVPALALEMAEDRAWDQAQDQAWVEVWEAWEQGVLVYPWAEDQCLQQDQDQDQCHLQDQDQTLQQGQDLALDQNLLLDQALEILLHLLLDLQLPILDQQPAPQPSRSNKHGARKQIMTGQQKLAFQLRLLARRSLWLFICMEMVVKETPMYLAVGLVTLQSLCPQLDMREAGML